jgi:hypothetical protein
MAFKSADLIPAGIAGFAKAIAAAATAAVAVFVDAIADGSVTQAEWKTIAIAGFTAGVGAYLFPNKFAGFKNQSLAVQVANNPTVPPVV